ncbi:UvrD-helicase domain-containing protein [Glutamicibacter protophormiae]|uniref:UvrD-helicase domain-containing protein n=1 Tax=Glutamicibacter protophormiae TaxID=37930 RepID=UPI003A943426
MAGIFFAKTKDKLDNSVRSAVMSFLEKLQINDAAPGLHIEPLKNVADARVRTGRVNDMWRAVLFRLETAQTPTYVYYGTWPHDKAIDIASRSTLQMNPVHGIPEIIEQTKPEPQTSVSQGPVEDKTEPKQIDVPIWENGLITYGYSFKFLTQEVGLDPRIANNALCAKSAQEFHKVTDKAPDWQGLVILDLAAGKCLEDTLEDLGLGTKEQEPAPPESPGDTGNEKTEDEKIAESFSKDAAKLQFTYIGETATALREVIEGGSADAWRTFLHPEQRRYADGSWNGPFRLTGGAGTGKTVVILHRAKVLAQQNAAARIILTTFTRTLATSLSSNLMKLDANLNRTSKLSDAGIYTSGIDALALQVFNSVTEGERKQALKVVLGDACVTANLRPGAGPGSQNPWKEAITNTDHGLDAELANPTFMEQEYTSVVLANFVATRDDYMKVPRVGRGTALTRPKRMGVWKIIEAYHQNQRINELISFPEIAAVAACLLQQRAAAGKPAMADHVLIDEAQDLHATHWLFLRALVSEGANDLFIAEDSHQRIYGQKVPLSRYGIAIVGRSRRLSLNYRTTAENLDYAVSVLRGANIEDLEGESQDSKGYHSARSGPTPEEAGVSSLADELDVAAAHIRKWKEQEVPGHMIGIIARTKHQLQKLQAGMAERQIEVRDVDYMGDGSAPLYMTMHRAKGMEFFKVILFGVNESSVPLALATNRLAEAERNDALLRERSLLYVAATRARDELVVSWNGSPSALLPAAGSKVSVG